MSLSIRPGAWLPLSLTLGDGDTGKYPQAELYSDDGTLLGTYDLTHRARGHYSNNTQTMPSPPKFVTAVYITYNDAGHTVESVAHLRTADIFAPAPVALTGADLVDGTVDVLTVLKRQNASAAGKIVRTLARYDYKAEDGVTTLFSFDDNDSERTPV